MRCGLCLLFAFCCANAAACASQQRADGTTWADDAREGITPHAHDAEVRNAGLEDPKSLARARYAMMSGARDDRAKPTANAEELELALMRFTTKRRSLMNHDAPAMQETGQRAEAVDGTAAWPRPLETAFDSVLEQLELGFSAPAGTVPRRLLIQARVTLEVEIEAAQSKFGEPPHALVERVGKLFAAIAVHMRASAPIDDRPRNTHGIALGWPISPVIVTSPFGYRRDPILGRTNVRFHAGIDLGGDAGDLVHAAGPGRVTSTGWLGGHGRAVVVQHPGGYQTMYAHLKTILTTIGAEVDMGTPIGAVGSSGRSTGPHLHFEVRHGGAPIDPLEVVDTRLSLDADPQESTAVAHARP